MLSLLNFLIVNQWFLSIGTIKIYFCRNSSRKNFRSRIVLIEKKIEFEIWMHLASIHFSWDRVTFFHFLGVWLQYQYMGISLKRKKFRENLFIVLYRCFSEWCKALKGRCYFRDRSCNLEHFKVNILQFSIVVFNLLLFFDLKKNPLPRIIIPKWKIRW